MKTLLLSEILKGIGEKRIARSKDCEIKHAMTNPKAIRRNTLFFDLKQEMTEEKLKKRRNLVVMTENKMDDSELEDSVVIIRVKDIKKNYKAFITYYRSLFDIPVIGITGTVGKTTIKEMTKYILEKDHNVCATFKNENGMMMNNRYLTKIDDETEVGIFEMGVSFPGNVRESGTYFKPTIGVIANIGIAHLQGCKTLEKYIEAKAEMLEALSYQGTLLLNADDENSKQIDLSPFKGDVYYFGQSEHADYQLKNITSTADGVKWEISTGKETYKAFCLGAGEHLAYNGTAAILLSHHAGLSLNDAVQRLSTFEPLVRHVHECKGINGSTILDDTWSCNPDSTESALQVLKSKAKGKKEIFVFGPMLRLGRYQKEQHIKMGEKLMELGGVDTFIAVGKEPMITASKAIELGLEKEKVIQVEDAEQLEKTLQQVVDKDSIVLFKLSTDKMPIAYRKAIKRLKREE